MKLQEQKARQQQMLGKSYFPLYGYLICAY